MYNDAYLGEKSLDKEMIKEIKKLTYNICRSMIDPLIGKQVKK